MGEVKLGWAIGDDGEVVHAISMVELDLAKRPRVTCPCCGDAVTIKAGERGIVTPHIAHRPESPCAATAPETAEHMTAKLHLAVALRTGRPLRLRWRCEVGHVVEGDWPPVVWTGVVPEFKIDSRRPDVALIDGSGKAVAAVEVLHAHRVDRAKARDLASSKVPWVELTSASVLEWDGTSPLAPVAEDAGTRDALAARCPVCGPPPEPPMPPEEIARQAREMRASLAAMKVQRAQPSVPASAGLVSAEDEALQQAIYARRAAGTLPPLRVAVGSAHHGNRAAVAALVLREGASPNVIVIERPAPVDQHEAAWLAVEHALTLVESKAGKPATLLVAAVGLTNANYRASPGVAKASPDLVDRVKAAVRRTRSVVENSFVAADGREAAPALTAACREALGLEREDPRGGPK